MRYIREHQMSAPVKRFRPDGTEYVVAWCDFRGGMRSK